MFFKKIKNPKGFTFIEIMIAISLIAILFLPLMQLFAHAMLQTQDSMDTITATNLAKSYMERTLNLHLSKTQLLALGDEVYPSLEQEPLVMNKTRWRITRTIVPDQDPLEIRIAVSREREIEKPVITLVTLFEDLAWEAVRPIAQTAGAASGAA